MWHPKSIGILLVLVLMCAPARAQDSRIRGLQEPHRAVITVPGDVALASLMTLTDGYLLKMADSFSLLALTVADPLSQLASTPHAPSAEWDVVRAPLAAAAARNVDALVWFARPDGSYWSVQQGQSSGNLSDRPYFPRALAGERVIGDLVVSKATGRSSAIVAVPIIGEGGAVLGVLGASVYLDQLSARLDVEMAISDDMVFYSFDATPLLAIEWDPQLIFVDPFSLGPEIRAVFELMLSRDEGTVRYRYRNAWRTAIFRRSQLTGWWYVVGVVGGSRAAAGPH